MYDGKLNATSLWILTTKNPRHVAEFIISVVFMTYLSTKDDRSDKPCAKDSPRFTDDWLIF